jgi:ABC-type bacteriocin/lantibiotic exporter with double-glycine peptidase domain
MRPEADKETPPATLSEALRYASRLFLIVRPYWSRIAKGIGLSIVLGIVGLVAPLVAKLFLDDAYPSRDLGLLNALVLGLLVLSVGSTLMGGVRTYYGQVLGARLSAEFGLLFFNRLQHLELRFFDERRVGEILSRTGDLQRCVAFAISVFQTLLVNGIYLVIVPPMLLLMNWKLALLAVATTPFTTGFSLMTGRAIRALSKRNLEFSADVNAYQVEVLSNVRVVKAAAAEREVFQQMQQRMAKVQSASLKSNALGGLLSLTNGCVKAAGVALFSWVAWTFMVRQQLTIGSYVAFSAYLGYLTGPVGQLASLFMDFQQTTVSLARFFEYFDSPVEQDPHRVRLPRKTGTRKIKGDLHFDQVTFGYDPSRPVLIDATFSLCPGQVTAFVGRSGGGKSSIIKLLLRMYKPQTGTIVVDGVDAARYDLTELRSQIGVVWQDTGVFRGTLRDNLVLGGEGILEADIENAIRIARLDGFVSTLPQGLATVVGEWGGTFSGGQRQRLAIARALIRKKPVFVFDEATSNLDAETEFELLQRLFPAVGDAAVLFVTHRLRTATLADKIYLVDDGRVTGGLPHEQMLRSEVGYARLWNAAGAGDGGSRSWRRDAGLPHNLPAASAGRA